LSREGQALNRILGSARQEFNEPGIDFLQGPACGGEPVKFNRMARAEEEPYLSRARPALKEINAD